MEDKIILEKRKFELYSRIFVWLMIVPISLLIFMYIKDFNNLSKSISILISPLFLFFLWHSYKLLQTVNNRIIISNSGITIEDYQNKEFNWHDITDFYTHGLFKKDTQQRCILFITSSNKDDIIPRYKDLEPDDEFGDGVPVCDLAIFQEKVDVILDLIRNRVFSQTN